MKTDIMTRMFVEFGAGTVTFEQVVIEAIKHLPALKPRAKPGSVTEIFDRADNDPYPPAGWEPVHMAFHKGLIDAQQMASLTRAVNGKP